MKYVLLLVLLAMLVACEDERSVHIAPSGPIRIAVLPDQSRDTLSSQYTPLLDYLENETSLEFELTIPRDYTDLLDQFDAGRVDLGWFGGLTFTQAERRSQAIPLVFRDVDLQFTSCYLTHSSDTRTMMGQFEGEDFSFGPRLSTSGHLMPRFFMEKEGVYPEQLFASIRHSAGHDQTARWVSEGAVALGVANCVIVQSLLENGLLSSDKVRIMETTPPYSDYVWAASPSLDEHIKATLLDAFLALDASIPEHREILRLQGANAYLPAASENFAIVRLAADRAGLFVEDSEN
ncbi:MAG: phosphate/phosphite/phosphonate ABC transporter substrate-binding protein [Gammaproteobacteria bacterium]|nr:phosphate/phosphite/phosphonate ABC transporter substrate-binding protein [Gammaproteobacteria bacterium]